MIGPSWLIDDVLRVEGLIRSVAGASIHPLVSEPALHLIEAGGKRLRPALVLLSSRAGEAGRAETDMAAAAVEMVHLATLYHDDVIDETGTRRGVPTAHSKWGIEVAVLAGDYLFACGCSLGADAGGEVPGILARAIARVCEGQIVETASLNDAHRSVDDYLSTIGSKTGELFRASCELGAATSGASPDQRAALVSYGTHLGLAFQIVDDLLDLIGDPKTTGKIPGTDLKEGVFTAPVLIASAADAGLADRLAAGERDIDRLLPTIRKAGGIEGAFAMAASCVADAGAALRALPDAEWTNAMRMVLDGVLAQVEEKAA